LSLLVFFFVLEKSGHNGSPHMEPAEAKLDAAAWLGRMDGPQFYLRQQ